MINITDALIYCDWLTDNDIDSSRLRIIIKSINHGIVGVNKFGADLCSTHPTDDDEVYAYGSGHGSGYGENDGAGYGSDGDMRGDGYSYGGGSGGYSTGAGNGYGLGGYMSGEGYGIGFDLNGDY